MKVLLLGGTRDALTIANQLLALNESGEVPVDLIYSVAGLLRKPSLNCSIHQGGFSQFADAATVPGKQSQHGLRYFLQQQAIDCVIDATHPYAVNISHSASEVCESLHLPLLVYCRPPWQATKEDQWIGVNHWSQAKQAMGPFQRPFVTIGRSALDELDSIPAHQFWIIRSAIAPHEEQARYRIYQAIGPFSEEQELALMQANQVDVVVCKNSGGTAVDGKLKAARRLRIPVIMLNRPVTDMHYGNRYCQPRDLISAVVNNYKRTQT